MSQGLSAGHTIVFSGILSSTSGREVEGRDLSVNSRSPRHFESASQNLVLPDSYE